jgi:hypothetical protein
MNAESLIQNWALPDRTKDRTQLTLRLNYDLYAKLHALKEIYPSRSVNDIVNDILDKALVEIVDALPSYTIDKDEAFELSQLAGGSVNQYLGMTSGLAVNFKAAYTKILNQKTVNNDLKDEN